MGKRILTVFLALGLVLCLASCGGNKAESVPTLSAPAESAAPVGDKNFEDDLNGLCSYLEANGAIVKGENEASFTEMSYREIGAIGGVRYRFIYGGGTVQVEFYEFDLDNLDEKGEECLSSVREKGFFTVLGSEVQATLHPGGKYMMIYNATASNEEIETERNFILDCFNSFKAE